MTGGLQIEYTVSGGAVDSVITETRDHILNNAKKSLPENLQKILTDSIVYRVSGTNNFVVQVGVDEKNIEGDKQKKSDQIEIAKNSLTKNLTSLYAQNPATITKSNDKYIWASLGEYIKKSGYITLTVAVIAISIYIMYAFSGAIQGVASWPFALVTGISLAHDVIITFGIYVLISYFFPEFKIDTFFLTALLTTLGYSINDTIVIMDRIRSELKNKKHKNDTFEKVIDDAIHGTMRRSLFTSLTVVFVLIAMFVFGPSSISGFALVLMIGTIIGTYSSIFLAAPLLVDVVKKKK